jgi:hypothetical protein
LLGTLFYSFLANLLDIPHLIKQQISYLIKGEFVWIIFKKIIAVKLTGVFK